MARPEDFGAVKTVRPEDFGATRISSKEMGFTGIPTSGEDSGMVQPTKEQLKNRDLLDKFNKLNNGEIKLSDLTPEEQKKMNFYQDSLGGSFAQRMGEGIKMTPEGKAGFVKATSNSEKPPMQGPEGKIYTYDSKTGQYQPFNPEGADIGDVGQFLGENIGSTVNAVAAVGSGGTSALAQVATQAMAGGGGSLLKQGASALLPGNDNMSMADRAKDVGLNAGLSGALQGVSNAIFAIGKYLTPTQFIARKFNKAATEDVALEGTALKGRLENKLGKQVFFDVAQETQDPWLMELKAVGEQSFEGKKMARDMYNSQVGDALRYSSMVVDDMTRGSSMAPQEFGELVKNTFNKAVNNAFEARANQAEVDYAPFNNNKEIAPITNFWSKVKEMQDAYAPVSSTVEKGLKMGGRVLVQGDDTLTIQQMVSYRQFLSKVARGKGKLFDGLDRGQEKHIASELMEGLDQDLEKAGDWVSAPDLKDKLALANKNYKANSDFITSLKANVLGRALRSDSLKPGEDISQMLVSLTNGPKSNVGKLRGIFDLAEFQDNPEVLNGLKEQYVKGLLTMGDRGAGKFAPGIAPYNPESFLQSFARKDPATFKYIFKDPAERQAMNDIVEFNRRIGSLAPLKGGVNPVQQGSEIGALVGGAASGNTSSALIFGPKFLAKWYLGDVAAKMVFDKEGQQALRTLAKVDPSKPAWTQALTYTMTRTLSSVTPSEEDVAKQMPEAPAQ
jgi:hypothetical protein